MAKIKNKGLKAHNFRNKLLLNQWLISLFGIDPLSDKYQGASAPKPFHDLVEPLRDCPEGMDNDNLHHFYHALVDSNLFWNDICALSKAQILAYEENIARHTLVINERRQRPVVWKYYQWLTLLFVEVYLDRFSPGELPSKSPSSERITRARSNL